MYTLQQLVRVKRILNKSWALSIFFRNRLVSDIIYTLYHLVFNLVSAAPIRSLTKDSAFTRVGHLLS